MGDVRLNRRQMMTYSPDNASAALTSIARGTISFESRAQLEHHLLSLLVKRGEEGVSTFLRSVPGYDFATDDIGSAGPESRLVAAGPDGQCLVVTTVPGPHSVSVNVGVEDDPRDGAEPDPRHRAFYEVWESMLGLSDSEVETLGESRKAVFFVGLLEAEVMNGGLGQYLSNTEGVHVDATLRCLAEIGTPRTAAILAEAARLGATANSFTAAWSSNARAFEGLDEQFMSSGEDLAGLTRDVFLNPGEGSGSV